MKIGIISDTHGNWSEIDKAIEIAQNPEMWLHLGDCIPDAEYLHAVTEVPVFGVAGNCDWPTPESCYERIVDVAGHKIFLTHGHNYGVRYTPEYVMEAAESQGADVAIYGHTHIAEAFPGTPYILNPGSASRPRDDSRGSFMIMDLEPGEEPKINLIRIGKIHGGFLR